MFLLFSVVLFILPFFWFPQGAMDLGGDGNRLYFYDPISFLKNVSLYSVVSEGKATIDPLKHAYLSYVGFIGLLKYVVGSTSATIALFHGIKLSVAFLAVYAIVREVTGGAKRLSSEVASILAGLFYILSTGSESLIFFWVKALHSHDQIFLNPLLFFLTLRYFVTRRRRYLFAILTVTFLFSVDFAMISAPPFFAFYPIAMLFLFLYVRFVRNIRIHFKDVLLLSLFFLGLHSYHLVPSIMNLLDTSSMVNSIVFKETFSGGVNFFSAIHGEGKAIKSFLLPSPIFSLRWVFFVVPVVILIGFIMKKQRRHALSLISIFFFVTFFLVTANITNLGLAFYRLLFYIPGFSMFRHFFVQWAYVYLFFYALLFGQSLYFVIVRFRDFFQKAFFILVLFLWIGAYWPFLTGASVDGVQWGSNNVKTAMIMDPRYEQTLAYIRRLPENGKILMLPLTDNFNQVIYGLNDAAYVGPSTISLLTPKKSFTGYQILYPNPLPEEIMRLSREKKFDALTQIFSLFSIRYIFHNTDPKVYEEKFPNFPNSYMMTSMPKTQKEYKEFVRRFPVKQIYENGPFQMFEFEERVSRPEIYIPDSMYQGKMLDSIEDPSVSFRSAFIEPDECNRSTIILNFCKAQYDPPAISLSTTKLDPTRYLVRVKQSENPHPFLILFQNSFHTGWKLSIDGDAPLGEQQHLLANMYANAWVITEADRRGKIEYVISLNLEPQKYFIYGLWITGFFLVIFVGWMVKTIVYRKTS